MPLYSVQVCLDRLRKDVTARLSCTETATQVKLEVSMYATWIAHHADQQ